MNSNGFMVALITFSSLSAQRAFAECGSPELGFRFLIIVVLAILEMVA
jgi:hypothetical protein